jgi:hypothetical protein
MEASNFIKQTLLHLKGEIGSKARIIRDFNTPTSHQWIDHSSKNQQRNFRVKLHYGSMDFSDIYITSIHPTAAEYTPTPIP